jgi:hypothetical protein
MILRVRHPVDVPHLRLLKNRRRPLPREIGNAIKFAALGPVKRPALAADAVEVAFHFLLGIGQQRLDGRDVVVVDEQVDVATRADVGKAFEPAQDDISDMPVAELGEEAFDAQPVGNRARRLAKPAPRETPHDLAAKRPQAIAVQIDHHSPELTR